MKQTSVELLFNKLWKEPKDKFVWFAILKDYKEMHKQEIIDAYCSGFRNGETSDLIETDIDVIDTFYPEEYYNKTFKTNEQ